MQTSGIPANNYLEEQKRAKAARVEDQVSLIGTKLDDINTAGQVKALQKNLAYQRVVRKHLKSLHNADEQNKEKMRSVGQALYFSTLNSENERDYTYTMTVGRTKPRTIMSCPWFVDKDGNLPPKNPDSDHYSQLASLNPMYIPDISLHWSADNRKSLLAAVRFCKEKYLQRQELRKAVRASPEDEQLAHRYRTQQLKENCIFDSDNEQDDEGVFVDVDDTDNYDAGWAMALISDERRAETAMANLNDADGPYSKLQLITPLPLTTLQGRGDAIYSNRQMNAMTVGLLSVLQVSQGHDLPEDVSHKAELRINWDWVALQCVRAGKTAVQCAQAWKNGFGALNSKLTFNDCRKIESRTGESMCTMSSLPRVNWVKLGQEMRPNRAPLFLYRDFLGNKLSKRNELSVDRTVFLSKVYGNDPPYIARQLRCSTTHVTTILLRHVHNKLGGWNHEESLRLCLAVKAYIRVQAQGKINVSWAQVARHIPHRNELSCRTKYLEIVGKGKSVADFTNDDDLLILELVAKEGRDFLKLQKSFPLYSAHQIKERWLLIASVEDRNKYYEEQDAKNGPSAANSSQTVRQQHTMQRRMGMYVSARGDFRSVATVPVYGAPVYDTTDNTQNEQDE